MSIEIDIHDPIRVLRCLNTMQELYVKLTGKQLYFAEGENDELPILTQNDRIHPLLSFPREKITINFYKYCKTTAALETQNRINRLYEKFQEFRDHCCLIDPKFKITSKELNTEFSKFADENISPTQIFPKVMALVVEDKLIGSNGDIFSIEKLDTRPIVYIGLKMRKQESRNSESTDSLHIVSKMSTEVVVPKIPTPPKIIVPKPTIPNTSKSRSSVSTDLSIITDAFS